MSDYKYEINGKAYTQKPLVLGQMRQLMALIHDIEFDEHSVGGLINAMGDKIHTGMAIVLIDIEESEKQDYAGYLRTRDITALADEISWTISPEVTMGVIEDFFVCNPIAFLLERLNGVMTKVTAALTPHPTPSLN